MCCDIVDIKKTHAGVHLNVVLVYRVQSTTSSGLPLSQTSFSAAVRTGAYGYGTKIAPNPSSVSFHQR
jgi:hypothetical protein